MSTVGAPTAHHVHVLDSLLQVDDVHSDIIHVIGAPTSCTCMKWVILHVPCGNSILAVPIWKAPIGSSYPFDSILDGSV